MGYKLIVSDLDETLLNDDHHVGQRNQNVILKARKEHGIKFVPATGRGFMQIQTELKELGLNDLENEYVISFNGGALTENKDNRLIEFKGKMTNTASPAEATNAYQFAPKISQMVL